MKKRWLLIGVLLCACVVAFATLSVSAEQYEGTLGNNLSWSFDTDTGTLTISGEGEMPMMVGMPWGHLTIQHVVIHEGVTSICELAFCGQKELITIEIPDSVTAIGASALERTGLTEFVVPAGLKEIPASLLNNCTDLKKITLHSGVTLVGSWAFQDCTALTDVVLPNGNYRFDSFAFANCTSLKSIEIPEGVWILGGSVFQGCSGLETVKLPSTLLELSYRAFSDCGSLKHITLPDGMHLLGSEVFSGCTALESVYLSATINRIDWQPFEGCVNLHSIEVDEQNPYFKVENGMILSKDGTRLVTVSGSLRGKMNIPASVTTIETNAARGCELITSVGIPQGITRISSGAFAECTGLEQITIPATVTSIEDEAFLDCNGLTRIDFLGDLPEMADSAFSGVTADAYYPEGNTTWLYKEEPYGWTLNWPQDVPDSPYRGLCGETAIWEFDPQTGVMTITGTGVLSEKNAWDRNLVQLRTLIIDEGITHIGEGIFAGSEQLTDIRFPASLVSIGKSAFSSCSSLISVTIPDNVMQIDSYAFAWCKSLENVQLPATLTVLNRNLFMGCSALEKIVLPEGITEICEEVFKDCTALYDITLPDTLTSIGRYAFSRCSALHSIRIPASVTAIGDYAFGECENLMHAVFVGSAPPIDGLVFANNEMYVYYPEGDPSWDVDSIETYLFQSLMWTPVSDPSAIDLPLKADSNSGACGPNAKWSLEDGKLTITGKGDVEFVKWDAYRQEIKEIVISDGITGICDFAFAGCSLLTKVILPNSVERIGDEAFSDCAALKQIDLPDSLKSIGVRLFFKCTSLEKIDLPDGIISIGDGAFSGCGALQGITLPEGLTSIGEYAFSGCALLKSITFPASIAVLEEGAFGHCLGIKKIYFLGDYPDMAYSVFTDVTATMYYPRDNATWKNGNVLTGGGNMTMVGVTEAMSGTCGENLTWRINGGVLTISGTGAMEDFLVSAPWQAYAKDVEKIVIEEGVTTIAYRAFFEFTALESVKMPGSLKRIDAQAFCGCTNLETIELPANLEYIGDFSFMDCKKLRTIVIPASVNTIFTNAFKNCKAMTTVYFEGSAPDMDYPFLNMTATVYYPAGDSSWNGNTMKQYGGKLTWQKYCPEGHTFGDWTVLEEPTYEKAGLQERTCAACGETEQQMIPMHQPTEPPTVPTEPVTQPTEPTTAPSVPATQPTETVTQPTEPVGGTRKPDGDSTGLIIGICAAVVLAAGCMVAILVLKRKQ